MGTGNSAANAAAQQQQQQQQQIQQAVTAISNAYSSPERTAQYQQYYNNLNQYYTNNVNQQEATNARNLTFANARSGLTGGSEAVDSNIQLSKDYTQGLLQASQAASSGEAALQQSDINSKDQLTSLAEQGNYTGQIPLQTSEAQSASLNAAKSYAPANGLNNLFGGTAQIYQNEQTAAANRAAQQSPIGSLYGSTSFTG